MLDILTFAWLNAMTVAEDTSALAQQVDATIQNLVSVFKGTDAVTLLEFLGYFIRNADSKVRVPPLKNLNAFLMHQHRLFLSTPDGSRRSLATFRTSSPVAQLPRHDPLIPMPQPLCSKATETKQPNYYSYIKKRTKHHSHISSSIFSSSTFVPRRLRYLNNSTSPNIQKHLDDYPLHLTSSPSSSDT